MGHALADIWPRGVWATILLDIGDDGSIRMDCISEQVAAYAEAGVDGVYCNGTSAEFHCQTDAQFHEIAEATAVAARHFDLPFQIGAAHPLPFTALERVHMAHTIAPNAIQITLPDWTPVTPSEAVRFVAGCAAAAPGTPLVLYNPPHAKTVLSPDGYALLADEVPQLAGLKCGGGDAGWYRAMAPLFQKLSVFVPGHTYASGTRHGAAGSYSNMACLNPAAAVAWARLAEDHMAAALEIEARIAAFMEDAMRPLARQGYFGNALDKAMAVAGGWAWLGPRMMWPFDPVPQSGIDGIRAAMRRHLPEFA